MMYWPSWRFGPNGQRQIFQSADEVPLGWFETPAEAEEHDVNSSSAPVMDVEQWEGLSKDDLFALLRNAGQKVHANTSARKAFEKCRDLGLLVLTEEEEPDAT